MREAIDKNTTLKPGEVVELEFNWLTNYTWLRAAQWYAIESRLKVKHENFRVISYTNGDKALTVRAEVITPAAQGPGLQQAGVNVTAVVIAAALVSASLLWYLSLDGTYKIIDTPAIKAVSYSLLLFAAAYLILSWRKK